MNRWGLFGLIAVGLILIVLSYFFVDRSVVWFLVKHHSRSFGVLKIFANNIVMALMIFIFVFYIYYGIQWFSGCINNRNKAFLLVSNAVVICYFLKDVLKLCFSRYWPATFFHNNLSLVSNQAYGFNWFSFSHTNASFPSGHATFIVSFATGMWLLFPKFRVVWLLLAILVMVGQVGMYYHFVSDVLAGALLGLLVGACVAKHAGAATD